MDRVAMIAVIVTVVLAFLSAVVTLRVEMQDIRDDVIELRIWRCVTDPVSCGYTEFPGLDEK